MNLKIKIKKELNAQLYTDQKTGAQKTAQKVVAEWEEEITKWDGNKATITCGAVISCFYTDEKYKLHEGRTYMADVRFSANEYKDSWYTQCRTSNYHPCSD